MKRELKATSATSALCCPGVDCKAHPDEKGTESVLQESSYARGDDDCKAHPDEKGTESNLGTGP